MCCENLVVPPVHGLYLLRAICQSEQFENVVRNFETSHAQLANFWSDLNMSLTLTVIIGKSCSAL